MSNEKIYIETEQAKQTILNNNCKYCKHLGNCKMYENLLNGYILEADSDNFYNKNRPAWTFKTNVSCFTHKATKK